VEVFRVLAVCHANLCRSPMAEHLLRRAWDSSVRVDSAGTHAWPGRPMHPFALQTLGEAGIDGTGFRSAPLTASLVAEADLVLTATRQQRTACVSFDPAAVRRTFTIIQFARYAVAVDTASQLSAGRLRAVLEAVPRIRAGLPFVPGLHDDLPDPVGRTVTAFRECRAVLEEAGVAMAVLTAGSPSPRAELLR
jgi:protein-tyrosine phosphatase